MAKAENRYVGHFLTRCCFNSRDELLRHWTHFVVTRHPEKHKQRNKKNPPSLKTKSDLALESNATIEVNA